MKTSLIALALVCGLSQAAILSTSGDKDCFGIPGVASCPDGSGFVDDLGGSFFVNYAGPGDPADTDRWSVFGSVNITHVYAVPPSIGSAILQMRIAGIHDINPAIPYRVRFNGVEVGMIPHNPSANASQEVLTYSFMIPGALLTGSDTVTWEGTGGDGYAIDYSELTSTVPEPGTLALALFGFAVTALGVRRIRRI